jgi:FAD/FMN-containing dehydrogenase
MAPLPSFTPLSSPSLRAAVHGSVIMPGDPEYDAARTVVTGGIDRHPAAIVRAADAADVARVVGIASATGLELAVRSGGHSGAGHGTTEGGILLDLSALKRIEVDLEGRTAWAEAGLTAGELTIALHAHGLAVGFGDTGSVGIGGITLGGGIGYLVRKHGLTIDSLLAADVVTAAGELVRADAASHPDLFWALRGGGGNFGVVTRFQFRLHEVGTILGGMLILPATAETVAGFVAAAEAAPEDLSTIANVMPAPPMPFVAPEHHGKLVVMALLAHVGDLEAGKRAVAPFRALAEPLADLVRPMAYPEIYPPEDPDYHPLAVAKGLFTTRIGPAEAASIVSRLEASDAPMRVAQLRVLGGAMARVPVDATAFAHRSSRILAVVAVFHDGTPEDRARRAAWADELVATLRQDDHGAYVNFLVDEGEVGVRAAYPGATWDRLAAVKRRYDPTNLFRLNQNVPPAAGEA